MRGITVPATALVVALICSAPRRLAAGPGDHWCDLSGVDWTGQTYIPVWIHPNLAAAMHHVDGTGWSNAELEAEVQLAIERFMDQTPSGAPPLRYMGIEYATTVWDGPAGNGPGGTPGRWNIAVRPKLGPGGDNDICAPSMDASSTGKRIYIPATFNCPTVHYTHWRFPDVGGDERVFTGVLQHEMLHALGFDHQGECQETPPGCTDNPADTYTHCGLMENNGLSTESSDLEFADWQALVWKYGNRIHDGDFRRESADALTWTTLSGNAIASGPVWASAWPWGGSSFLPILATDLATLFPHFYLWNVSTHVFNNYGVLGLGAAQFGPVAVSLSASYWHMFTMSTLSPNISEKHLCAWLYTKSSPTYAGVTCSGFGVGRQGVGGTYDPKSGRIVHVYLDETRHAFFGVSTIGGQLSTGLAGFSETAAFAPSIACGDASIDYNCIAVWAGGASEGSGENYHFLKWQHFKVDLSQSESSPVFEPNSHSVGYVVYTPPTVVYRGPADSTQAFVLAFYDPGVGASGPGSDNVVFTMTKSTTGTGWGNLRSHTVPFSKHLGPPLLGARGSATVHTVEAWSKFDLE